MHCQCTINFRDSRAGEASIAKYLEKLQNFFLKIFSSKNNIFNKIQKELYLYDADGNRLDEDFSILKCEWKDVFYKM